MEVPKPGELEMQLQAYATATVTQDLSCICDLHYSSQQCQVLNPLGKAGDQACIIMDTSWVLNPLSHNRNSLMYCICYLSKLKNESSKKTQQQKKQTTQLKYGQRLEQIFLKRSYTDGQQGHEKILNITITEMQIKDTMRYHLILVRMVIITY